MHVMHADLVDCIDLDYNQKQRLNNSNDYISNMRAHVLFCIMRNKLELSVQN